MRRLLSGDSLSYLLVAVLLVSRVEHGFAIN
jgi:hypothetical protein